MAQPHSPEDAVISPEQATGFKAPRLYPGFDRVQGDHISFVLLDTMTTWTEPQWRKAVESGHLPAYRFPNGRIALRLDEVRAFVEGFENPVPVQPKKAQA